jgi:hypothetical protein
MSESSRAIAQVTAYRAAGSLRAKQSVLCGVDYGGIDHACSFCGAGPGAPCVDPETGGTFATEHDPQGLRVMHVERAITED